MPLLSIITFERNSFVILTLETLTLVRPHKITDPIFTWEIEKFSKCDKERYKSEVVVLDFPSLDFFYMLINLA